MGYNRIRDLGHLEDLQKSTSLYKLAKTASRFFLVCLEIDLLMETQGRVSLDNTYRVSILHTHISLVLVCKRCKLQ